MRKWRQKNRVVVEETMDKYIRLKSFIDTEIGKKQWPYKVISGESESERVLVNEDEFMILPDSEHNDPGHLLVLFKDVKLTCLRELRGEHVALLQKVQERVKALSNSDCKMMYFHYPPSVWQLHLHVVNTSDGLRTTNDMQKVHFLSDVMQHLVIDSDFYRKNTMTFVLPPFHDIVLTQKD
jgi:diadenosine tetraphosphate (Ap4A) HIT family hydrolase